MPPRRELRAEGRRLLARVARVAGAQAARAEALYGYEAMRLVLDAIRAGGPNRERVRQAGTRIRTRESALGDYLLRGTGDVDTQRFSVWALREGRFEFVRTVEP